LETIVEMIERPGGLGEGEAKLLAKELKNIIVVLQNSMRGVKGGKAMNEDLLRRLQADLNAKQLAAGMRLSGKSLVEMLEEMGHTQGEEDELLDTSPTHGTPRVKVMKSAGQVYEVDINFIYKYSAEEIIPCIAKLPKGDKKRELIENLMKTGAVPVKKTALYKHVADFIATGVV
jgi:hypothetical protein